MSSARKRAAIRKAENDRDRTRQQLMLAEHHRNVYQALAEEMARRLEAATDALETIAAQTSGLPGSTAKSDCMAAIASAALLHSKKAADPINAGRTSKG